LVIEYPNGKRKERGIFIFSPSNCWAVREATIQGASDKSFNTWAIEYDTSPGKVPRVKSLINTYADLDGQVINVTTVEVTKLVPGSVPEDQFTLAAFGLTDSGLQQTVPPWYYIQLIAVLALVLMLIFRVVANRKLARLSSP